MEQILIYLMKTVVKTLLRIFLQIPNIFKRLPASSVLPYLAISVGDQNQMEQTKKT